MFILNSSAITFSFSAAAVEIPFTQRADKQNLSFVSTTRCSFKRRIPCTYTWKSLFWIHRGRRQFEQRHGDPDTFLSKYRI